MEKEQVPPTLDETDPTSAKALTESRVRSVINNYHGILTFRDLKSSLIAYPCPVAVSSPVIAAIALPSWSSFFP